MHQEEMEFDRINLMEYFTVAWKRRWQIIIPTFVLVIIVAIWSFTLPKVWEVNAIIIPSKFLTQNQVGEFKQVLVAEPKQIASQIMEGSYNSLIGAELNISDREFPNIKAENIRDTNLIRVSVRVIDPQRGRQILTALFNHLKSDFDRKIDVEINSLNTQVEGTKNRVLDLENEIKTRENSILTTQNEIKNRENSILTTQNDIKIRQNGIKLKELDIESKKIDKEKLNGEIESDKSRLKIGEARILSIFEEMKSVKTRIDELEKQQQKALAERKTATDALALLLYSNEVQQNLRYNNSLEEKVSAERLNRESLNQSIQGKMETLRQIDNQISQIRTGMESDQTGIESMKTGIENIKNEILKIKTGIENIKNDILNVRNNINNAKNDIKLFEDKKNRIDYTQLVKEPTPSFGPVSPNKKQNILIAGFLGFCLSLGIVFFREILGKQKKKDLPKT
jgi:capsular polysaccharide biosynthesis protein